MTKLGFTVFSHDPVLRSLGEISIAKLHSELGRCIPEAMLDAPLKSYQVTNLRYSPRQKLIIGLTSTAGAKPIALRVFPRGLLRSRLEKARLTHPTSTFLLNDISAVAWVFPGERKLNLNPLADQNRLSELLHSRRGYRLTGLRLMHFVPEHAYTARVNGIRDDGSSICEYLKIYYNDNGAVTASVMRQLAAQAHGSNIRIPDDVSYFPEHRMLVQSALPRDEAHALSNTTVASALACFHGLSASAAHHDTDRNNMNRDANHDATVALIAATFPSCSADIQCVSAGIRDALRAGASTEDVLLHGDAHLGNLFPMPDGRVGIIDLDQVHLGEPEEDLASFFAFKLWMALRERQDVNALLKQFPEFLDAYNLEARIPVSIKRAYRVLAHKIVTERIRRGIRRGKIADASELIRLAQIAVGCLDDAERSND